METKKIKNFETGEIYVHPEHTKHSLKLDFWRDNGKLHKLKLTTEEMSINELKWMMEVPFWEDDAGNIVLTPNEVLQDMDKFPDHRDRINNCDTSYALHIMQNDLGEWVTLDGLHRLVKLILDGAQTVKVKKVTLEQVLLTKRDE